MYVITLYIYLVFLSLQAVTQLNNDYDDLTSEGYACVLIDDNRSAEIIDMLRDDYLPDETSSRALGLTLNDEFKDVILSQVSINRF